MEVFLFVLVGLLAVGFAFGMLLTDNAVHSALFLIANFGCVAFLYLMLDAPFLAMVQIAVYAGAIMVLFLFVIMLLGAEQTQDTTTRKFSWLTRAATVLGVALMIALGLPLVLGDFHLPETSGKTPLVRIVHAATAPTLDIEVSGTGLPQPWRVEDIAFGKTTEFQTLAAGDYTLTLTNGESGAPVAQPQTVTLAPGQVVTVLAGGELSLEQSKLVQVFVIQNDLQPVNNDAGRFVIFNGYSADPVTLVDLGPDAVLNTDTRDGQLVVIDPIIAENIAYEGAPVVGTYGEGIYSLAFIKPVLNADTGAVASYATVETLSNYKVTADTENTVLLVKDGAESPDSSLLNEIRSTVIPGLVIDTLPTFGSPLSIGRVLFTVYLLPVNLVGLLLLVALLGVIVISRPSGEKQDRRSGNLRRRVSRPLVNVISQQTGGDVVVETPKLGSGSEE